MQEKRYSRQRETIYENLKNRYDHPTAMELYMSVRDELPNLSLGTLYRNLSVLRDSGKIIGLLGPNGQYKLAVQRSLKKL